MKKSKAIALTIILSALMALCLTFAWALKLHTPVYIVLGILALLGCVVGIRRIFAWILADAPMVLPLEPPMNTVLGDDALSLDYESIRNEVRGPLQQKGQAGETSSGADGATFPVRGEGEASGTPITCYFPGCSSGERGGAEA